MIVVATRDYDGHNRQPKEYKRNSFLDISLQFAHTLLEIF